MTAMELQQAGNYHSLFDVTRPRSVRIRASPRIILAVYPLVSVFLVYFGARGIHSLHQIRADLSLFNGKSFLLIFAAVLIASSAATLWAVRRDLILLRDGELAVGVVTHQRLVYVGGGGRGGRRKQSRVRYRFKDASGQMFQGTGRDPDRRLRVDMTVPIFYKSKDPEKNVAICAATCELKTD
jgi:hypothetical protein